MANSTILGECSFENQPTDPIWICLATMYILFGVVYNLFGYRCFKAVMFLTGFTFAAVLVYLICIQERVLPTYANAGIATCAGILFGLITMTVQYVGLFVTGFHTGLLLCLATLCVLDNIDQSPGLFTAVTSLLAAALFFAIINLHYTKGCTIFGTAVYGAALMMISVDYLVEGMRTVRWVWRTGSKLAMPCYPVLLSCPLLLLIGLAVQIAITPTGSHHSSGKHPVRTRTREQRAELRQNKYRYLYQVRTAHGDVISQNYVQAIQNKVIGPGETSTLESDATHLTMLPDGQTDFNRSVNYYR